MVMDRVKFIRIVIDIVVFYVCVVDCCGFNFNYYIFWVIYGLWDINYFVVVKGFVKLSQCFYCVIFCVQFCLDGYYIYLYDF